MSGLDEWQESNARQLGEALAQLRQRLERHIQQQTGAPPSPEFPAGEEASETTGKEAPAQREELPSALALLSERLGLSAFERDILLLCAAMELDTRTAALCARAQDDPNKPFPTFALALALFAVPWWDALSPERLMGYWRLLVIIPLCGHCSTASSL